MSTNTKKVNLEELKMETLKKAVKDIETISDVYQRNMLRLMLVQSINGMSTTAPVALAEGREALDNTKPKTNNKAQETVNKVQEALSQVESIEESVAQHIEDEEQAAAEAVAAVLEAQEATEADVQAEGPITIELEGEEGPIEVDITEQYIALTEVPDDDNKKLIAYYLGAYDEDSILAITNAFSSEIESNPYALLNADNYVAYLEYFNACLQG